MIFPSSWNQPTGNLQLVSEAPSGGWFVYSSPVVQSRSTQRRTPPKRRS